MIDINKICNKIRMGIIERAFLAGKNSAHIGGSLSSVEIMAVLYHEVMQNLDNLTLRDRFILSKGHASLALYCTLETLGLLTKEDVDTFEQNGSHYTAHAKKDINKLIEFSGGSLGLGISYSVGVAHALKMKNISSKVYVLIGDGECNEGIVWESLMYAKHYLLDNLRVIVDYNRLQADGPIDSVMNTDSLVEKFAAFGFEVKIVDGHSTDELRQAFNTCSNGKPIALLCQTVKGKGVSFMENKAMWHFATLPEGKYKRAITELLEYGKY